MGAIVFDASNRLLLVKRGRPPGAGLWSVPGGRLEPGESDEAGLLRELLEETGLRIRVGRLAGTVERPGPDGVTYVIRDYVATVSGGTPTAGDDAADVRWCTMDDLGRLPLTDGLLRTLAEWDALPAS
ncbi:ADP-ribose pyrophosphatase YjhB, NUDIX family [Nonomuraea maritima]|uniref:ADP-ribose pyrophosphatase YjhB, NUDIX family n=1 Tax=Nonomuraea maritima TaxID=683260 RepID=A0A1G9QWU2_9ACTN|nr:NUDIX hydrolase [Nonomuraea maritima]SDM15478.1 ADP-ribose pyrophosphatase YjhB, NUDIX family [Nonomuraea maritima]